MKETTETINPKSWTVDGAKQLFLGALFGIAFGFLLQKGGVAKFEVLVGVLLLHDFTVIQVMLSAIVVGMVGVSIMTRFGLITPKVKPTQYGPNSIGGLIFGVGFALSGYCPGTGAAALGQGNYDAFAVMVGMIAGSYLFGVSSNGLQRTVGTWGARGTITTADLVPVPRWVLVAGIGIAIAGVLVALAFLPTLPAPPG